MRLPKIHLAYVIAITIIVVAAVIASVETFQTSKDDLVLYIVTVVTLVVSFLAFIVAFSTYLSIDSVNIITQMEGNVLENENYVTSITSLLKQYNNRDSSQVAKELFDNLEKRFSKKNSHTAIEFSNNLQYFIDLIVLFPALFRHGDENRNENIKRMDKILGMIDSRRKRLLSISSGNLILIDETVNLIKSVMDYQSLINRRDYNVDSSLLEVRGTMLKNSVTQTVYYNYLGLFYNKKAMNILKNKLKLDVKRIYEVDTLEKIINEIDAIGEKETELCIMYFNESKKCFEKAIENCEDDVMWKGFIKYNDARSTFFLQLLLQESYQGEDWNILMNEAVIARSKLNTLITDVLDRGEDMPKSHLQTEFIYQEYLARLVKMKFQISQKRDITNTRGVTMYHYPDYQGLEEDRFVIQAHGRNTDGIKDYQQGILDYLRK